MPSIADLGIKVDSTDAAKASSVLDKLTAAAGRTEKATEGVARGADKASKATKNQTNEMSGLLGKVGPTFQALGRLDGLQSQMSGQKKSGSLDVSIFSENSPKPDDSLASMRDTPQQRALKQHQEALERTGQLAVFGVGHGDRQNNLNSALSTQEEWFAKQKSELENQRSPSGKMSDNEYKKQSQDLTDANNKATDQIRKNYADLQAAQGDWSNGATAALENYLSSAGDVAGKTKALFTGAFSSMEDAVFNFAMTGKLSFSDLAKSILADMARVATRQASSSLLSSLFSAGLNYFAGGSVTPTAVSVGADGYTFNPQLPTSDMKYGGGRATGGDVSPNSLYQVNERGPELFSQDGKSYLMSGANGGSVTPLGAGGAAVAAGAGGVEAGSPNVYISIASDGSSQVSSDTSGLESFGKQIGEIAAQKYRELEAKSLSSQGNIRQAINGRR